MSWDISAGPSRSGRENHGHDPPNSSVQERVHKRSLSNSPSQHKRIIVAEGEAMTKQATICVGTLDKASGAAAMVETPGCGSATASIAKARCAL